MSTLVPRHSQELSRVADPVPVALAPFADPERVSTPFPCFRGDDGRVEPLPELLDSRATGTILRDNLRRLERAVRRSLEEGSPPVDAREVIARAGARMVQDLGLSASASESLANGLEALVRAVPDGVLIPYGPDAALDLLAQACRDALVARRAAFLAEASRVHADLGTRLRVEDSYEADTDHSGLPAGASVDPGALARLLGARRGTVAMDPEKRSRLQRLVDVIGETLAAVATPELLVVHGPHRPVSWSGGRGVRVVSSNQPELEATSHFDALATPMGRLIGAVRSARLELSDAWDASTHGPLLDGFGWSDCTDEELPLLAPVIVVTDEERALGEGMRALSALIASGRPVQILLEVAPARNPSLHGDAALTGYRVDPAMIAMAHLHAFVQQSTPARPEHLVEGYALALSRPQPAVHLVDSGHRSSGSVNAWLAANAAVESRAMPLFHYDPAAGETWADCMDVSGNPQPERDWGGADDEPFTFADYAVIDPELSGAFRAASATEATAPVDEWLRRRHAEPKLSPIVRCMIDGEPQDLVPSVAVLEACVERRGGWRALRELGGVGSEYARRAAAAVRAELTAEHEARIAALEAAHAAEIERVRNEAGSEALSRLAAALLDEDWSRTTDTVARTPAPAAPAAPAPKPDAVQAPEPTVEPAPAAAAPAPAEDDDEEPWIESSVCTSCNDCMQINPLLFVYNDDKQAMIGDLASGTYAQLVLAAEKCPAKCIYPGTPQDPSEAGLDALRKRAAAIHGAGA